MVIILSKLCAMNEEHCDGRSLSASRWFLTFSADAAQVSDLHEGLGEHEGHAGSPLAGVDLQRLQQWLLQHLHLQRLLQVMSVCADRDAERFQFS